MKIDLGDYIQLSDIELNVGSISNISNKRIYEVIFYSDFNSFSSMDQDYKMYFRQILKNYYKITNN